MTIEQHALPVLEAEVVDVLADLMPTPLQYPPAVIEREPVFPICACGKRAGDEYAHGAIGKRAPFSCEEVIAIRKRVEASAAQPHRAIRRLFRRIRGGA